MASTILRFALVACVLLASTAARAQTFGRTVVMPYGPGAAANAQAAAELLEAALQARRTPTLSMHEARDRFIVRSRPPLAANDTDVDVLAREAQNAIEHVAFGRSAAAQRSVREVLSRAERALESLNRETTTARQVLDACLALVRSALQEDDRREALAQAMACRRLVPDVGPNENLHPASVIGVLAEADDQLRRMRIGRLTVQSVPESSCAVYLNGRHLGTTPFLLDRAAAGSYRVQVECGEARGRVHVVDLGEQPVEIVVDTEFDRAIRSEPRLLLSYGQSVKPQTLAHHAELAGKVIKADDVVLVGSVGQQVELSRVQVKQGRVVARIRLPWSDKQGFDRVQLQLALDTLAQGRIEPEAMPLAPVAALAPVALLEPIAPAPPPERADAPREKLSPTTLRVIGASLAGVGAAGLGIGIMFEMQRRDLQDEAGLTTDKSELDKKEDEYDSASKLRWIGVSGGVLGTAALPLLVKPRAQVPWWSWAVGGAGLVAAGVGTWQVATANHCENPYGDGTCATPRNSEGRGGLILSASAPLLALPLTHLFLRSQVEITPSASPDHAALTLRIQL